MTAAKLAEALEQIADMCMAPPNFSDATIRDMALAALAAHRAEQRCKYCERFFSMYRCNKPDECDCPKCQGMCECGIKEEA